MFIYFVHSTRCKTFRSNSFLHNLHCHFQEFFTCPNLMWHFMTFLFLILTFRLFLPHRFSNNSFTLSGLSHLHVAFPMANFVRCCAIVSVIIKILKHLAQNCVIVSLLNRSVTHSPWTSLLSLFVFIFCSLSYQFYSLPHSYLQR